MHNTGEKFKVKTTEWGHNHQSTASEGIDTNLELKFHRLKIKLDCVWLF